MGGYSVGPTLNPGEKPWPKNWTQSVLVRVCHHPEWESTLVQPDEAKPFEEVVRCVRCHAPRCGDSRSENPCMLRRHHTIHHVYLSGSIAALGGVTCSLDGCACMAARDPSKKVAH